ncbi:MAG: amino acid ABC transporter substrate-binding protein [Rhodospirillales bacterium]|jgi:branched-chain amino acid transport system substrate-binding protein|nr:amino acid ABC transporter substrate-binding protein [Rhodospirillales bacterium]MBT4038632.1 amino acid ABC transporter substrate-binding protein [Rhodospirillales bacterium]MBT4627608.1 amino acid ABC transporter substrate-binding protein [Rhodospirillales bacterium]MBT5350644.1 amino acid ABC transporter substrate-binding protein [Rhodospirillales bacterium]MBT5521501.1 amino acid ABC transporter substrate-binding protein [Rhodospirillales bacterium]
MLMKTIVKTLPMAGAVCALVLSSTLPANAKVEGDTIIFGAAVSFTGKYSTNGKHTKNGYDLAVERINAKGGVTVAGKDYKIAIQYYDDESTPARAAQLAEKIIQQDEIKFVLGPYGSGLTKAVAPVTEKYKIPMVEGNGASRSLFNKGYKYLFAVLSTSEQYLTEAINLAAEQATKAGKDPSSLKVAIAVENDPFSQDVRAGIVDDANKHGMQIVIDDKLPKELNDMTATLTKVKALRPDILVVSGHSKGAVLAVRQVNEMKVNVPMLAVTHCEAADVIGKFGAGAENTLCATQWTETMSYEDSDFGTAMDYYNDFNAIYGYYPPYQAAESTASVQVFVDAMERAGSFDTEAIRDALAATDLMTFYGPIKFTEAGNNMAKPMVLRQIINGKLVAVAPSRFASEPVVYPRPDM